MNLNMTISSYLKSSYNVVNFIAVNVDGMHILKFHARKINYNKANYFALAKGSATNFYLQIRTIIMHMLGSLTQPYKYIKWAVVNIEFLSGSTEPIKHSHLSLQWLDIFV